MTDNDNSDDFSASPTPFNDHDDDEGPPGAGMATIGEEVTDELCKESSGRNPLVC